MTLDAETITLLAAELAERLEARRVEREGWVSADVVARHLGTDRDYVYEHAAELGGVRLGEGPKARLRFRLAVVDQALASCSAGRKSPGPSGRMVEPKRHSRRRPRSGTSVPLLPIRDQEGP